MGQFWSGITTDPNTAPLLMLLGATFLAATPWRYPESDVTPELVPTPTSAPQSLKAST